MRLLRFMPGVFLSLALLTACFGGSDESPRTFHHADCSNVVIDWVDAFVFGGRHYVISPVNRNITFDTGTAVARVLYNLEANVCDPYYRMKDGDATFLREGTAIFAVEGYDPDLVLAAGGRIYEARAEVGAVGADQLPFSGGVVRIAILSQYDGKTEVAAVEESSAVQAFVDAALGAPVDDAADDSWDYFLEFELSDGLRFQRNYNSVTGVLLEGIEVPETGQEIIRAALP